MSGVQPTVQPAPTTRPHEALQQACAPPAGGAVMPPGEVEVQVESSPGLLPKGPGYTRLHGERAARHSRIPENVAYGFTKDGRYIGVNPEVPYPFENQHYHREAIPRNSTWTRHIAVGGRTYDRGMAIVEHLPEGEQMDEYFTAENDEGYNQWLLRKAEQRRQREEAMEAVKTVPLDIKTLPGHALPALTVTENEQYGRFVDMLPKRPLVYPLRTPVAHPPMRVLVNFRRSNMSDHPPIPDHAFPLDPRELITQEGCYTRGIQGSVYLPEIPGSGQAKSPYTFQQSTMNLGEKVGERQAGFTLPYLAPSGLEFNRPVPTRCVSILASSAPPPGDSKPAQVYVPAKSVPKIYKRYVTYNSHPGGDDKETEPNPAKKHVRLFCAPHTTPYPTPNPCKHQYVAQTMLPLPQGVRQLPDC